jgi:outer membrane protein TolC
VLRYRIHLEQRRYAPATINLRLAAVTPIPDVALKVVVQKDYTTPPFYTTANVEVGVPVPIWDRNQGNIQQAQGQLARALQEAQRARLDSEFQARRIRSQQRGFGRGVVVTARSRRGIDPCGRLLELFTFVSRPRAR